MLHQTGVFHASRRHQVACAGLRFLKILRTGPALSDAFTDLPFTISTLGETMKTTNPDMQKLPEILLGIPGNVPVVMLNLLKFRDVAVYKDGSAACSGREAYRLYSEFALGMLASIGAEVIFMGAVQGVLIAPPDESWDEVLLVRYPSVQAFMGMLASAEYRAATRHRTAALDDARLVATAQYA